MVCPRRGQVWSRPGACTRLPKWPAHRVTFLYAASSQAPHNTESVQSIDSGLACFGMDFMLSLLNHQKRVLVSVACLKLYLQIAETECHGIVQDPHRYCKALKPCFAPNYVVAVELVNAVMKHRWKLKLNFSAAVSSPLQHHHTQVPRVVAVGTPVRQQQRCVLD